MGKRSKLSTIEILNNGCTERYNTRTIRGEILGTFESGYNLPSGGWSLHRICPDGTPAKFAIIRTAHRKRQTDIPIEQIVSVDGKPFESLDNQH